MTDISATDGFGYVTLMSLSSSRSYIGISMSYLDFACYNAQFEPE